MIKPFEKPIYVTRPFLPPFEEFCKGLEEIWETRWLTNDGPILRRFTQELCNFFESNNVCLFNNGMLALQIGLQGMDGLRYGNATKIYFQPPLCGRYIREES